MQRVAGLFRAAQHSSRPFRSCFAANINTRYINRTMSLTSSESTQQFDFHNKYAVIGSIVHSLSFGVIEIIENGMIVYNKNGIIDHVIDLDKAPVNRAMFVKLKSLSDYSGMLITPGFIDAHCHAPQYVFSGTGMDLSLLTWLQKYTFPCEARFADANFARASYEKSIQRHLKLGTTFASYFATIHNSAGRVLVDVINRVGQRAFVGKVSMDRNSPDFYIEDTTQGCADAEEFVRYVLSQTPTGAAFMRMADKEVGVNRDAAAAAAVPPVTPQERRVGRISPTGSGNRGNSVLTNAANAARLSVSKRPRSVSMGEDNGGSSMHTLTPPTHNGKRPQLEFGEVVTPGSSSSSSSSRLRSISFGEAEAIANKAEEDYLNSEDGEVESDALNALQIEAARAGGALGTLLNTSFTPRVMPCVTPRFVPTCTPEMMESLGAIANKYGLPVQSHLSESVNEVAWVKELHPDCDSYAAVYKKYNLLNERVYMAHCCHSDLKERDLLAECRTGVVHCASSNFSLDSGVMDVHGFIQQGIKVGLGTDVAGGYSSSMLDAIRQTIIASKVLLFDSRDDFNCSSYRTALAARKQQIDERIITQNDNLSSEMDAGTTAESISSNSSAAAVPAGGANADVAAAMLPPLPKVRPLSYREAFHLATMGSAEVLGMDQVVGNFLPGKKLDCLIVNPMVTNGPFDTFDGEGASEHFQKFLFLGDDRNIVGVYVDGRQVL